MIAHLDAFDRHYPHLFVYLRERDEIKRGFRERVKLSPKSTSASGSRSCARA